MNLLSVLDTGNYFESKSEQRLWWEGASAKALGQGQMCSSSRRTSRALGSITRMWQLGGLGSSDVGQLMVPVAFWLGF